MGKEETGMSGKLIVIGGGVRCGKSRYALELARACGAKLGFVATAQAYDDEMEERIEKHKAEREDRFHTIDAPFELEEALSTLADYDAVVVDCLTLWLSNLLLRGDEIDTILARVEKIATTERSHNLIIVTNEVGMGVVPESKLGRAFRDLSGLAHQRLSESAHELYFATLGTMLRVRPEPITAVGSTATIGVSS